MTCEGRDIAFEHKLGIYSIFQAHPIPVHFQKVIHTFHMSTTLPIIVCTEMDCANKLVFHVDKPTHTAFLHLYNCGERLQISHPSFRIPRMFYG